MAILVTGNAGFIGFHTAKALLERGDAVVGLDVVNDYYDPGIKEARLKILAQTARASSASYSFIRANLADRSAVERCFEAHDIRRVINLAAQAGVRYSLENPHAYVESNITGLRLLELNSRDIELLLGVQQMIARRKVEVWFTTKGVRGLP